MKPLLDASALRDALLALRPLLATDDACRYWCAVISNLVTDSDANKQQLSTPEVCDALVVAAAHATTADACRWWCAAVASLAHQDGAKLSEQLVLPRS